MIEVECVDFVSVPTRDVERAKVFYREVLGLPESSVTDGEIETPNVTLSFRNPERDGEEFVPNDAGIALRVADVIGVEDTGVCTMGFVRDPDGNTIILHRRYAPRG